MSTADRRVAPAAVGSRASRPRMAPRCGWAPICFRYRAELTSHPSQPRPAPGGRRRVQVGRIRARAHARHAVRRQPSPIADGLGADAAVPDDVGRASLRPRPRCGNRLRYTGRHRLPSPVVPEQRVTTVMDGVTRYAQPLLPHRRWSCPTRPRRRRGSTPRWSTSRSGWREAVPAGICVHRQGVCYGSGDIQQSADRRRAVADPMSSMPMVGVISACASPLETPFVRLTVDKYSA